MLSPAPSAGRVPPLAVPDPAIDRFFQDFRESAVRLAEGVNDLNRRPTEETFEEVQEDLKLLRTVFGKWSPEVLVALHVAPAGGLESLRRRLAGISPRILSLKLKELEEKGMIRREVVDSRPPRVRYSLTERGWTVAWLTQPVLLYLKHTQTSDSMATPAGQNPAP